MSVLTPSQREFLARFFARENSRAFYLTGGGALAAYYLQHRLSQDLDLFTLDRQAWTKVEGDIRHAAEETGAALDFRAARPGSELHRALVRIPGELEVKLDIVRDAPPHFGEFNIQPDGVIVDSWENIAVGKLLALYARAYPRDFVDLYFILVGGQDARNLLDLAKDKDAGLINHYLADMLRQVARIQQKDLPILLKPLDFDTMKQYFLKLADEIGEI